MNTGIYKIENVVNGNCYIGQSVDLSSRQYQHFWYLKNNSHGNRYLQNAYKKHGKDNFVFSVLLYCEKFELTRYEQFFVDYLDPKYNIQKECVNSPKGIKPGKTTLIKRSLALTGKKRSEETKQKLSLQRKGRKLSEQHKNNLSNHLEKLRLEKIGKPRSEETKQKLSLAHKGKPWTEARRNAQLKRQQRIDILQ